MPQTEINQLRTLVHDFVVQQTESTSILKTSQANLNNTVEQLISAVNDSVTSSNSLELKITSLEEKSISKIEILEGQADRIFTELKNHREEISGLKEYKATLEAKEETKKNESRRWNDTWMKGVGVITIIISLFMGVMAFLGWLK